MNKKASDKIATAVNEAVAVARGEAEPARAHPIGVTTYDQMKARMTVARGERQVAPDEPKTWMAPSALLSLAKTYEAFDPAEYLTSEELIAEYLAAARADPDQRVLEQAQAAVDRVGARQRDALAKLNEEARRLGLD